MNQFQTASERKNFPDTAGIIPNSLAFLGGIESWVPLAKTGYLYAGAEAVYTDPYMYILSGKGWSYYRSRRENVSPDTRTPINNWTGTPFGPDSFALQAKVGWKVPGNYSVYAGWQMWIKGENDFAVFNDPNYYPDTVEEAVLETPTGVAVTTHRIFLNGDWDALSWLTLGSTISAGWIDNDDHVLGKKEFSAEFAINAKIKFH
jgi:hypothetical protein